MNEPSRDTLAEVPAVADPSARGAALKGTVVSRLVGGSLAGSLGFVLSVAQAVLQVPLLLQVWTAETFAVWMGVQGLFALLTSVDVGFHAFVGAEVNMIGIAKPVKVQQFLSSALRVTVTSAVVQVCVCALAMIAGVWIMDALALGTNLANAALPMFVLSLYWLLIGACNGLLSRIYLAYGETVRYQLFGVFQKAVVFLAVISTAWGGGAVLEVTIAFASASGAIGALSILDLMLRRQAIFPRWRTGSWAEGWLTLRQSFGISSSNFLDQVSNGGLAAFVAGALPSQDAAQFSTIRALTNAVSQASGVIMFPTVPEMGRDASPSRIYRASLLIDGLMLLCVTPLAIATSVASPWIPDLYRTWTRGALSFDPSVFVALATAVLIRQAGMPFQLFLIATNQVRAQFLATLLRATTLALGVGVTVSMFGCVGVAVALAVSEACVSFYAWIATAIAFDQFGARLGRYHVSMAVLHVAASGIVMAIALGAGLSTGPLMAVAAAVHGAIAAAQIYGMPTALGGRAATWGGKLLKSGLG